MPVLSEDCVRVFRDASGLGRVIVRSPGAFFVPPVQGVSARDRRAMCLHHCDVHLCWCHMVILIRRLGCRHVLGVRIVRAVLTCMDVGILLLPLGGSTFVTRGNALEGEE